MISNGQTDALRGEESESPFVDTMQFNKTSFVNKLLFFYRASHTDYKYLYGGMEEVTWWNKPWDPQLVP